jgi:hypothetical protein
MPIPFKSDHVIEHAHADDGSEEQKITQVAGGRFSSSEAREVWPQVLEHKWYMSERLGRDVGVKAAAADYFENVRKVRKRDQVRDTMPPTLPFVRPLGYR